MAVAAFAFQADLNPGLIFFFPLTLVKANNLILFCKFFFAPTALSKWLMYAL
ncbi:hypothetical protein BD408DRAFT_417964 [Parasitella parasitica]|nr:hypothetical protein BD408DRAFT_417964 [Parasitella parasitica]